MKPRHLSRFPVLVTSLLILLLLAPVSPAAAARDRTPPTTPKDLRVTGMTAYSVSLAWTPSTDNSGSVTYTICCANNSSETFPGPASTHVYTAGLEPGRTFTFRMFARDPSGNVSKYSNSVTFTLPRDTTQPAKPSVSVTDVGATHISLAWSAVDDSPKLWFTVWLNGSPVRQAVRDTSGTFGPLEPETSYTFTVQAMDFGGNRSPVSDPLTVTTEARDTSDTVPPTTPTNFRDNGMSFQDGETWLFWDASSDDVDPPSVIRYDVYVNGVFDHSLLGYTQTVVYGNAESENTFAVIAVDSAGNESTPATLTTCAVVFC